MSPTLDWTLTLIGLALAIGLFVLSNLRAGRPADPLRPRWVPWKLMIVLSAFMIVLAIVHMANLLGVETGPDKSPFGRF
jgi:predicted MFS family arabinose efflux permease